MGRMGWSGPQAPKHGEVLPGAMGWLRTVSCLTLLFPCLWHSDSAVLKLCDLGQDNTSYSFSNALVSLLVDRCP